MERILDVAYTIVTLVAGIFFFFIYEPVPHKHKLGERILFAVIFSIVCLLVSIPIRLGVLGVLGG